MVSSSSAPVVAPGADGAGDPYFPKYGNGGYDVAGYDLRVRYDPAKNELTGTATITATATQVLSRFNLDLSKLTARNVTVDGVRAGSSASGAELTITPATGIASGRAFTAVIEYGGQPAQLPNAVLGDGGWLRETDGGGAIALGQPESASTWYPVNDHPSDKATFKLAMTVPDGVEVISTGVPGPRDKSDKSVTWHWAESAPMASYLSTVVIGQYRMTTSTHAGDRSRGLRQVAQPSGVIPQLPVVDSPGASRSTDSPVANAFGGQVIGSTASPSRRRSGSTSPVNSCRWV